MGYLFTQSLTNGEDSPLLLVHLGAGDEGEDALVDLVQHAAIAFSGELTQFCGNEPLQIARRSQSDVVLAALQASHELGHLKLPIRDVHS